MRSARVLIIVWMCLMLALVAAVTLVLIRPEIDFSYKILLFLVYLAIAMGSLWMAARILARHVGIAKKTLRAAAEPRIIEIAAPPRRAILERIGDINDPRRPRPLVGLELFFEGNNDPGSIGYNLPDPPEPRVFFELLKTLRGRDDVRDVLIEVKDLEDPDGWPSSDSIWFITTAPPDEVTEGFDTSNAEPCAVPDGFRAVRAWYD